jgi:serine/threonine protein kinase
MTRRNLYTQLNNIIWHRAEGMQADLYTGEILDSRYELVRLVDSGTFGAVYEARDSKLGRIVAVKILFEADNTAFRKEARLAVQFEHPNVVRVFDYGNDPFLHVGYIVMEFLRGQRLDQLISAAAGGEISDRLISRFTEQIGGALEQAHRRTMIHRDLKPQNVMVVQDAPHQERFVLLDLGLASQQSSTSTLRNQTMDGALTVAYASPEQLDRGQADHRSDIYAFGTILYELLCGRTPFAASTLISLMKAICLESPPPFPPKALTTAKRAELEPIVRRCLAKSPEDRLQSMSDLCTEVLRVLDADLYNDKRVPLSKRRILIGAAAVSLILGFLMTLQIRRDQHAQNPPDINRSLPTPQRVPDVEWPLPPGFEPFPDSRLRSVAGESRKFHEKIRRVVGTDLSITFFLVVPPAPEQRRAAAVVSLRPFYMMEHEVWNDLYFRFQEQSSQHSAGQIPVGSNEGTEAEVSSGRLPVVDVTPVQAEEFAMWLGGENKAACHLPSLDQWVLASGFRHRNEGEKEAQTSGPFRGVWQEPWPDVAVNRGNQGPLPVGSSADDIAPSGCRDLAGNVLEMTETFTHGVGRLRDILLRPDRNNSTSEYSPAIILCGSYFRKSAPLQWTDLERQISGEETLPSLQINSSEPQTGFRVVLETAPYHEFAQ